MEDFIKAARSLRNRGKAHIFLGDPLSDGCDKTTVEPGNGFSPGVWTCGVTTWIAIEGKWYTPDLLDDGEIAWGFGGQGGLPPIVVSEWSAGGKVRVVNRLAHLGAEGAEGADFCSVELTAFAEARGELIVLVKDVGPAGGKIESLHWCAETSTLTVNGALRVVMESAPAACDIAAADGASDSPMAVLRYPFGLRQGQGMNLSFKAEHGFSNRQFGRELPLLRPFAGVSVSEGFARSQEQWEKAVPAKIFCPDGRIEAVWQRECFHILSAMECGLPRIGAVNYPVFWMRDGVIVLRALDLIGRHDLARLGNEALSTLIFAGGFGAEADAPGEGIWSLVSHAKLTKDCKWLEEVFPLIEKRVRVMESMLAAEKPVRAVGESRIPFYVDTPGINVLCFPAVNGTIHGRMDWHTPDFFINCWAECGLRLAAEAAKLLGKAAKAEAWAAAAERLSRAIAAELLPRYGNERDPIVTPYPTGALKSAREEMRRKFGDWYAANRLNPSGGRKPEPLWTYFEAAQIHNALLLGLCDMAWASLDGMLAAAGDWDVSAFAEGRAGGGEAMPFRNGEAARGWLHESRALGGNMPHNWTSAELVNLIRDIFVREEDGVLLVGTGVPEQWLVPGARFGVRDMPTEFGPVSYTATVGPEGGLTLQYRGPDNYRLDIKSNDKTTERGN